MFYLYRPFFLGEDDEGGNARLWGGNKGWVRGRWWYGLAHVCRRWRNVILERASYLGVSMVCTNGLPVADMLAHSPPISLVVDYIGDITAEDEEGAILAFKQCDRVRHVRLQTPVAILQRLVAAMDEEYPILEYLIIMLPMADVASILTFPETLHAPHLRHVALRGFALPIGSRLLTTAVGLVTLCLSMVDPSTYFHPNTLLQWISHMPQLEVLLIYLKCSIPNRDIERELMHTPVTTHVTLPNFHHLLLHGASTYLEALVRRITTPRLEKLDISFFNQLTFSIPRLLHLMNTTENLRLDSAIFIFSDKRVQAAVYPRGVFKMNTVLITVSCWHLDWQLSSMVQISNSLSEMFSTVEHLTLQHQVHSRSSEEHNEVDRAKLRKLFGPFSNVKTFRIDNAVVSELSRCLQLEDGELPLELLPELQELSYPGDGDTSDAFNSFIDARQNAGRTVTLVRS